MQVINIWKASREFAKVILSERLGRLVSTLAGWPHGSRLAQDQVWVKPPGAGYVDTTALFMVGGPCIDICSLCLWRSPV